jgi:hypothetical protein
MAAAALAAKSPATTPGMELVVKAREARAATDSPARLTAAADYGLSWYSFNGGGVIGGESPNQGLSGSVGQNAAGAGAASQYRLDLGFMAGAEMCSCPHQGDYDVDGFVTALDLGTMIDVVFAGHPNITDPNCPTSRVDFNCDGFPEVLDIGSYIDYIFGGSQVQPCEPCTDL